MIECESVTLLVDRPDYTGMRLEIKISELERLLGCPKHTHITDIIKKSETVCEITAYRNIKQNCTD